MSALARRAAWLLPVLLAMSPFGEAMADHCPATNAVTITHRPQSYCELCGTGQVALRVTYSGGSSAHDITHLVISENFGSSGLVPIPGTTVITAQNGGGDPAPAGFDPTQTGTTYSWDLGSFQLESGQSGGGNARWVEITFQVRRENGVTEEGLWTASKAVSAAVTYTSTDGDACGVETQNTNLPFRAPNPNVVKLGRNADAGQTAGEYADPVYGHNNDDVIWRIEIQNNGLADMQDVRLDDLMAADNLVINYACASEAAAATIAGNNGGGPIPAGCVAASNTVDDFEVADPFGAGGTTNYLNGGATNGFTRNLNGRDIDVDAGGSAFIYLVGKITANGSCINGGRTNTVSDVQFGCEADGPSVGGIAASGDTAVLHTYHGDVLNQLTIQRSFTGVNTVGTTTVSNRPVGARGLVTLTITNNTGGTIKDIVLDDVLPPQYVVDPTYWTSDTGLTKNLPVRGTPVAGESSIDPFYNAYAGMVDRVTWLNPQGSLASPSQDPLQNTAPRLRLWSSTSYTDGGVTYEHLLRHGDVVTVTFPIVLISQDRASVEPYDLVANLDVTPEVTGDGTDPAYTASLSNQLTAEYRTFCAGQGNDGPGRFRFSYNNANIAAFPEDLDVAITDSSNNPGAVFILTNDPNQQLPLRVRVTNNGGHDVTNYRLFVSFGATMEVVSAPSGCSVVALSGTPPQPNPWKVWVDPEPIPGTATVYQCTSPASIPPGATRNFDFAVIKTSDPARIQLDDLTFRADVVGEIVLHDGTPLWFPTPIVRPDGQLDRANNYSLDGVRQRVIGFNLVKTNLGCNENEPPLFDPGPYTKPAQRVEIGEECSYRVQTGGWFGFETPGFVYIAVRNVLVTDSLPAGQGYVSSTNPYLTSSGQIAGISLMGVPVPPQPNGLIAPGAPFNWAFNQETGSCRDAVNPSHQCITQLEEWFEAGVTARVLNNPINARANPNQHTANSHNVLVSTFDAIFADDTGDYAYSLGPSTVGYPNEPIRREDLTITEPHLVVEKHVCNESLHGTGTACNNWTTLTDEGDTYDSYIFRITVRNQATVNGLASSPAYDVVVTDTLDSSDLMYIVPFAGDGLDNDGDSLVGGSDANEGTISDNVVLNGSPAVITFSHTHSTALQRINPGSEVQLYYRVDPDQRIAPMQVLTNIVGAGYDTLAGSTNESGNQTVDPRPTGDIGGARSYTSATAQAQVQIIPLQTFPKEITALSATPLGGSPQEVKIGEEIQYRLTAHLPVARLRGFFIQDYLPAGVRCSEAPVVDLSQPPYGAAGFTRPDGSPVPPVVPSCTDNAVVWNFGDVVLTQKPPGSSYFVFPVSFIARVDNAAANDEGTVLSNGMPATNTTLYYLNDLGQQVVLEFGQIDVVVREPDVAVTKSFAPVVNADAGDELIVTVTATNNGTAGAYNLRVLDDLVDRQMTFIQGSVSGTDPPAADLATLGANRPIFTWAPTNPLAPGATRTFTFRVRVDTSVQPRQILENLLQAAWTSLPSQATALNSAGQIGVDGSLTGMRIGRLPHSDPADPINDYESVATASVSVPPLTIAKADNDPGVVPTIGAQKSFTVEVGLPEGTTLALAVTDALNSGSVSYVLTREPGFDVSYEFLGIASINGQPPAEAAFNAYPADGASGSIVWNIGTVVTQTENDLAVSAISPRIRITYHARVNNDLDTDAGDTLRNAVVATYTHGETGATESITATTSPVTVVEPVLTVSKTASNVTPGKLPGDPASGGDVLEYVVTIPNGGTAAARDVNVVDTLPPSLTLDAGFTATATVNGVAVSGFVAAPANAPDGPLVWGRDNGDGSLDIPAGQSLVLTYRVVVREVGGSLTNSVWVDWTSLDGASVYERTGAGCPGWTAPNDYCVGPASATTGSVDTTTFAKTFVADTYDTAPLSTAADAIARIGDVVTYRLALNLRGGLTRGVQVQDTLPAGMAFVDVVSVNGDAAADYTPPAGGPGSNFAYAPISAADVPTPGQTGVLVWSLGDIVHDPVGNPTGTFEIVYRARIVPDAGIAHVASTTLTNNAALSYVGSPALADGETITARQPIIGVVTKTDRGGRTSPAPVNVATDTMAFRLQACNASGQAPAYSVLITDTLATQLDETSIAGPTNGAGQPDVAINGLPASAGADYVYTAPAARGGTMTFRLNTPVNPGQCVTIDYDIGFHTDFGANQTWNNSATVIEYWSLPAQSGQRYGPVGPATFAMHNVANTEPPTKTVVSPADGEATIGEEIVYRVTVPGTAVNAAMHDVAISDVLDANLEFVSATEVSGNNFTLVDNSVLPSQVNLSISQIPAGQQAMVDLRLRVRNNEGTNAGVLLNNSALYTYANTPGGTTIGGGSASAGAVRIVEPLVTAGKTVVNASNPGNPPRAGDILRYTLTFTGSGGAAGDNFADAFDLSIVDTLSLGLEYAGNATVNGAGNTLAAAQTSGDGVTAPQTVTWGPAPGNADIDIVEGTAVTVSYDVRVLGTVLANQTLSNSVVAQWTGIDGPSAHERNGTATPAYNDYYTAPVTTSLTTGDNNTAAKARLTDTYGPGDANVRIGDLVEYELRLGLQEGTHGDVVVTDTLPQGLRFEGITSVNGEASAPYGAVPPFAHADLSAPAVSGDAATGPTILTWNLGDVVNMPNGNGADDAFVIVYRARVLNEVLAQANAIALSNDVTLSYATASGTATRTAGETITVLQPNLAVTKSAVAAGGDAVIQAGEVVTYTVDIINSGTAPAYDVVLRDVIPAGLRNGAATVTVVGTSLLSGSVLPDLAPVYDAGTGIATWNFDTGVADAYTIPAGDTLRLVYRVQADADLGAGLTMTNAAQVQLYYSFDDEAVPGLGGIGGVREVYGPTNTASATLTTALPGALAKQNPSGLTTVSIGQPFTYRITVPATPVPTALHDVRILDDLSATGADLRFVSVAKVSGSQPWTPVNTGTATNLVIEDPVIGIDIPPNEQVVIDITVVLGDSPTNASGLQFSNTASYTYNAVANDPATRQPGSGATTGTLTIVGPDRVTLDKTGPAQMRPDVPGTFTVTVHNTYDAGTDPAHVGPAWGLTVVDRLPNPSPGGMCDAAPTIQSAGIYDASNNLVMSLTAGTHYSVSVTTGSPNYLGQPSCDLTLTLLGSTVLPAHHRLIVNYQARLDADNPNGQPLTNVAAATRWYGANPAGGATPHAYVGALTDGTIGVLDNQDAHTVGVQTAVPVFQKTVQNMTSVGSPTASPGDVLRYTLMIRNTSDVPATGLTLLDELDRLNTLPVFQPGTLTLVTVPAGADSGNTNPTGGAKGTGLIDIRNLSLAGTDGAPGGPDELLVVYEARLVTSITNGEVIENQARLLGVGAGPVDSDDPNVNGADDPNVSGDEDPTQIAVVSAPDFRVLKTSQDVTGDAATLIPGDILRYTITVKNVGNEDATNVVLQDAIPANTTYVPNSTSLNGVSAPDAGGASPLQAGMLISAPGSPTPGAMRADADPSANNVATVVFDVIVDADASDGAIVSNQGFVNGTRSSGAAFPAKPSDDPTTPAVDDPTVDTVIRPNGIVYDSVRRQPIAGATVSLQRILPGLPAPVDVSSDCFNDPAQQNQVTPAGGYYKFDLNFSRPDCQPGDDYVVTVKAAPEGYDVSAPSRILPPTTSAATAPYSVPLCPADAVPATTDRCEAQASDLVPTGAAATTYYLHLTLNNGQVPEDSQIYNNHIAVDPDIEQAIAISKTTPLINVTRGQLVPYTITVKNTLGGVLPDAAIVDTVPPGFKYVAGSGRLDGRPVEPAVAVVSRTGQQLRWENLQLGYNETHAIRLLLVVGSGVAEGEYVNQARVVSSALGNASAVATATVRVVPDPTFDCTDIIGKVYEDANLNGYQDDGEKGLPGVRVVSARGLVAKTDAHGRFHITCAAVPNEDRGGNFILKVDDRSLPAGYRLTTENPLVQRVTRGKAAKFNFGAGLHRIVRLDIADGVFEPNTTEVRPQWVSRFGLLLEELRKGPAILRISYLADVEEPGLVKARLAAIKEEVARRWAALNCCDRLTIETEIFWRRGGPPGRKAAGD
ncbi:DUF11 domain-containing protein [Sulfurifustis variabilis]|nr:DUF11 domain-containing protein [Sulfurifustis variabilis]